MTVHGLERMYPQIEGVESVRFEPLELGFV
jgi:hypothetical protein